MTRNQRSGPRRGRSLRGASLLRLRVGLVLITMVVSVFAVRLVQLQGLDPQAYAARAEAAGLVNATLPATRGEITDRNGEPLAESVGGEMLVADPTQTTDHADKIARIISSQVSVDYFDTLAALRDTPKRFRYIARRVPSATADAVVQDLYSHGFSGVYTRRDPVRDYPAQDVGANLLGFLGADGKPLAGLERTFNHLLSGTAGSETYEVGANNQRIPLGENSVTAPKDGRNLSLTIDRDVQWYVQRTLRQAVQGANADSGAAVVLDTHTGETLALADYPTFDANAPLSASKQDLGSRALSDVYEPGSVEKVLTASSLIDAHKVTPRTRIVVPPELPRQGHVIHDYFVHPRLHLTLTGVIAKSSNIGTVLAAEQFRPHRLWHYLRGFGLGQRTGVGVNGESPGLLSGWQNWSRINLDTIAFGQGVSVNALQMAAAINTVANGGVRVDPSLVQGRAVTDAGHVVGSATSTQHRVVSERAAQDTAKMMEMVVDPDEGTAPDAAIPGYRVAGKTGTAQRVGKNCGCYDGTFTVSFAGFAPADNPRFTVYVVVQNPRNGGGGGSVGGPVFQRIMTYLLRKYAVPPTGSAPAKLPIEW